METRFREINAKDFPDVTIELTPGHFVARHAHVNYYINPTPLKCYQKKARKAANALASQFLALSPVDTIVCLDGAEIIATHLAALLSKKGGYTQHADNDIAIVTPENNVAGQLIFRDNTQGMIRSKNVVLLVASAITGKTIGQAVRCIHYYGGTVSAICALFSAVKEVDGLPVNAIFTRNDVPDYETYKPEVCPMCKASVKIDALVNNYGYSKL